jgi:hypothetical protein
MMRAGKTRGVFNSADELGGKQPLAPRRPLVERGDGLPERRQNRRAEADIISPAWRLASWDFTGFHDWVRRKGAAKTKCQSHPQVREFDSERQERRFIKDLQKRLGGEMVVWKLRSLRELLAPPAVDQFLPGEWPPQRRANSPPTSPPPYAHCAARPG